MHPWQPLARWPCSPAYTEEKSTRAQIHPGKNHDPDPHRYATRLFEPPISAATRLHSVLLGVVWVDDSRVILSPRCATRVTDDALAALRVDTLSV